MDWTTSVAVHESVSPGFTRERILGRLSRGEIDPHLLYAGLKQTSLWIELHRAVSPAQQDATVSTLYDEAFARCAALARGNVIHVVSLACGDGGKDVRCLQALRANERAVIYTCADTSLEMALTAFRTSTALLRGLQCTPLLCDLAHCSVLPAILKNLDLSGAERLILFLGTIHNYWPPEILKPILYPLRAQDHFLIGANLAPADDYDASLRRILVQYDNGPTRAWLLGALAELGIDESAGELVFSIVHAESDPSLRRIEATFRFARVHRLKLFDEEFSFESGAALRVFYSYRFTPAHLRGFFQDAGLGIVQEWLAREEGLFLCRRA